MRSVNMAVVPEFEAEVLDIRETESGGMGFNILTEGGLLGLYATRQLLASYRPRVGDVVKVRIAPSGVFQGDQRITVVALGPGGTGAASSPVAKAG